MTPAKLGYIKPHKNNSVEIIRSFDQFVLKDLRSGDARYWMSHTPRTKSELGQLSVEIEFGYGHCVCTGMGLGLRETYLADKPEVTKITVVDYNQDVIDWYREEAPKSGVDIGKFEFVCQDADRLEGLSCDCLFLDHYDGDSAILATVASRSINIARNNRYNLFWFWPALYVYADWAQHSMRGINADTFAEWQAEVGLTGFLPGVDTAFVRRHTRKYFGVDSL